MDEKLQEQLVEFVNTARALVNRWGTTTGRLNGGGVGIELDKYVSSAVIEEYCRIRSSYDYYTCFILKGCNGIWTICDNVYDGRSTMSFDGAVTRLEKCALYFASEDFDKKIKGSIGRLKKIRKALE